VRGNKDLCGNGLHEWIGENIYVSPAGKSACRECRRVRAAGYRKKRAGTELGNAEPGLGRVRCLVCGGPVRDHPFGPCPTLPSGARLTYGSARRRR